MFHYVVFIGIAISLFTHLAYIKDTLRGKTRPNRVSWLMWSVAPLIASGAAFAGGSHFATFPVLGEGLVSLAVFLASFVNPRAYWKLETFDYACGAFSFIALIMWLGMKEPNIAIIFSIASDAFATIPTVFKAWKSPESESGIVYVGALVTALSSFAGIQTGTFAEYAFPIFLVIGNSILVFSVYRHRLSGSTLFN